MNGFPQVNGLMAACYVELMHLGATLGKNEAISFGEFERRLGLEPSPRGNRAGKLMKAVAAVCDFYRVPPPPFDKVRNAKWGLPGSGFYRTCKIVCSPVDDGMLALAKQEGVEPAEIVRWPADPL